MTDHATPSVSHADQAAVPVVPLRGTARARRHGRGLVTARALLLAFAAGTSSGCYAYVPLPAAAPVGRTVQLEISDRGRVGLSDSLGPSVRWIEGRLDEQSDSAYQLSVSAVGYVNGTTNKWSGERITVRSDFVGQARERKLSRARTIVAVGVATAATLAFILTRSVFGSGSPDPEPLPTGNPNGQ